MIIHRAFYREATLATLSITAVLLVIIVFQGLSVFLRARRHGRGPRTW